MLDEHLDTFALDVMGWGFSQVRGPSYALDQSAKQPIINQLSTHPIRFNQPTYSHPPKKKNQKKKQLEGVSSFSAEAKRAYLYGFWRDVLKGKKMVRTSVSQSVWEYR